MPTTILKKDYKDARRNSPSLLTTNWISQYIKLFFAPFRTENNSLISRWDISQNIYFCPCSVSDLWSLQCSAGINKYILFPFSFCVRCDPLSVHCSLLTLLMQAVWRSVYGCSLADYLRTCYKRSGCTLSALIVTGNW
jgi:hypothetical protein